MRKIIFSVSLLLLLSGCTLWKQSTDFSALYEKHISAQFSRLDVASKSLGLQREQEISGAIHTALILPVTLSGSFDTQYSVKTFHKNIAILLQNVKLRYDSMMGTGGFDAKKLGMISHEGDAYFLFSELASSELLSPEIQDVLKKFDGTWMSWTRADAMKSLSGASEQEVIATTITNNIAKMSLKDIESYLTKYPIWKSTGESTQSGNLTVYPVELNTEEFITMLNAVSKDITGSGLTDTEKSDLQNIFQTKKIQGTMAFDPNEALTAHTHLTIVESGAITPIGQIDVHETGTGFDMNFLSIPSVSNISLSIQYGEKDSRVKFVLTQSGIEMGSLVGTASYADHTLQNVSLDIAAQGVSVRMTHTQKNDGNFEGHLQLPVGAISWNGKKEGTKLTELSLKGALPTGSIDMNLIQSGSKIAGPLVVRNGSTEMFRANVGLLLDAGKMGLNFDLLESGGTGSILSFDTLVTYAIEKLHTDIDIPKNTQPLQSLVDALDAIMPKDALLDKEIPSIQSTGSLQ